MNAIDVTRFREVPVTPDGRPLDPADPSSEIVRTPGGGLYMRGTTYRPYVPTLQLPDRTSPLLAHALRPEWWRAWFCRGEEDQDRYRGGPIVGPERVARLAELVGDTAGNDERIAWGIVNLTHRTVLALQCDLAGLGDEAKRVRALPELTAGNIAKTRRTFRRVERAAEEVAPWSAHPRATQAGQIISGAAHDSGLLALNVALIGCDVKESEQAFSARTPLDAGQWPAVRAVYYAAERATCDTDHAVVRAAGKVATVEQAERFTEQLHALVEGFLRDLPRARRSGKAVRA